MKCRIAEKISTPRSYIVEQEIGTEKRRNCERLIVRNEQFERLPIDLEGEKYNTVPNDIQAPPCANPSASTASEGNDTFENQPKASGPIWFR